MCRVVEAEDEVTPLRLARIDAARGIGERIEYEVPADPAGWLLASNTEHYIIMPWGKVMASGGGHTATSCDLYYVRCRSEVVK